MSIDVLLYVTVADDLPVSLRDGIRGQLYKYVGQHLRDNPKLEEIFAVDIDNYFEEIYHRPKPEIIPFPVRTTT